MNAGSSLLSTEQKSHFREHGYCVVDHLFSEAEIAGIEAFFEDYKKNGAKVYEKGLGYEEMDATKMQVRAMQPHRYSRKAQDWFLHPRVGEVLAELLEHPALGVQTMYYFKPPGARGQGMHQDNFYLLAKPATCIAAWTAIDDADNDNGCLWVVPGSHRGNILCSEEGSERWNNYGDSHITKFPS